MILYVTCIIMCYAYCSTPVLFLAFLGSCGTPLEAPPYWETSLTLFFLEFLGSSNRRDSKDRGGTRPRSYEEVDYVAKLYSIKH